MRTWARRLYRGARKRHEKWDTATRSRFQSTVNQFMAAERAREHRQDSLSLKSGNAQGQVVSASPRSEDGQYSHRSASRPKGPAADELQDRRTQMQHGELAKRQKAKDDSVARRERRELAMQKKKFEATVALMKRKELAIAEKQEEEEALMKRAKVGRTASSLAETVVDSEFVTDRIVPKAYVQEANAWRAEVGVPPLEWDEALANVAQAWADKLGSDEKCDPKHSDDEWQLKTHKEMGGPESVLGENIEWACCDDPPWQDGKDVVDFWAKEKKRYVFGPAGDSCTSSDGGKVAHYMQLVWSGTKKMGCGMHTCGGEDGTVWVCNFYPPGDWKDQAPFCEANLPAGMTKCPDIKGLIEPQCEEPSGINCGMEGECCSCQDEEEKEDEMDENGVPHHVKTHHEHAAGHPHDSDHEKSEDPLIRSPLDRKIQERHQEVCVCVCVRDSAVRSCPSRFLVALMRL